MFGYFLALLAFAYAAAQIYLNSCSTLHSSPGRCYELATGPRARFLGPFPTARRLRAFYRLGRRPGTFGFTAIFFGLSGTAACHVVPVGGGVWHVVPFVSGFTLDDVPDTHRVGADAAAALRARAYWKGATLAHEGSYRTETRFGGVVAGGRMEVSEPGGSVGVSGTASLRDGIGHAISAADQMAAMVRLSAIQGAAMPGRIRARGSALARGSFQRAAALASSVPEPARVLRLGHETLMRCWQLQHGTSGMSWRYLHPLDTGFDPAQVGVPGIDHFVKLTEVAALEAAKVLNTAVDSLGEAEVRMASALTTYSKGVRTSVPPSDPAFAKLTRLLGPLAYKASIEAHGAAATIRRAALAHASRVLVGARVGLVSPSNAELHTFPNAAVWLYRDSGLDRARRTKHCTLCQLPDCAILAQARQDKRVLEDNNAGCAADFFRRFDTHALLLLNIEPNIHARDLLRLLVRARVYSAYSLASLDWRVLVTSFIRDKLIGMTTLREGDRIVSSFSDGGDYVQLAGNAEAMFRPTTVEGHSLRRTAIFGSDASQYFELSVSESLTACRCVPGYDDYYFIRVPTPDGTAFSLLVERAGFDRVLATYRTQAIRNLDTAKIVLRQANVTYSIAGTQVTPRIELTATQAEALAVWVVVYSEVQDVVASNTTAALSKPKAADMMATSIWQGAKASLLATAAGQMALGTASAVENALGAFRRVNQEKSIDRLSEEAFLELFGPKVSVRSVLSGFTSRWTSVSHYKDMFHDACSKLGDLALTSWRTSFGLVDLVAIASLSGVRFTAESVGMLLDFAEAGSRIAFSPAATATIQRYQRAMNWKVTKYEHVWTNVQRAQTLDFQAAVIDIVEVLFNTFSSDYSAEMTAACEAANIPAEEQEIFDTIAALPYSDFLSEVKLFLGRFNSRVGRKTATADMLRRIRREQHRASQVQIDRMVHFLKAELAESVGAEVTTLGFALGGPLATSALPLKPLMCGDLVQDVRQVFHENGTLRLPGTIISTLQRLSRVGKEVDFSPIHAEMDRLFSGEVVDPRNLGGVISFSPDERGARLVKRLVEHSVTNMPPAHFAQRLEVEAWLRASLQAPGIIEPVAKILREATELASSEPVAKWVFHIDGLAMGGKSAGVRRWITNNDLVVVPTRKLKEEWQEALGKQDPLRRASIVTQHEAIATKYTGGYVFVDEAYTFDPEHLQLIANRHARSKGIVTIGDGHQIGNVFSPSGNHIDPTLAPIRAVSPVTFVPWDVAAMYLSFSSSPMRAEAYYCGSDDCEGLLYTLSGSDTLLPGEGDLAIQGTQNGKAAIKQRGVANVLTAHESQGARSQTTVIHGNSLATERDLEWLRQQAAHLGVSITRARERTIFVLEALSRLSNWTWVDTGVNGKLMSGCIFSGTSWDFVDPRTEDDAIETYIHEAMLVETSLDEMPTTNPITIGTVFAQGEAVALSEIRAHVNLVDGVKLIDEGIKHSDAMDQYTFQPRDVPGVDQIQALTRAVNAVKPTHADFCNAEVIVERLFRMVIDPKIFFAHLSNSRRNVLKRRERSQVIDGAYADVENRRSTLSFGFLKPEFAKKPSELPGELKAQGVITASALQQAMFMDACDALTHAWARSMRQGKFSPVGFKEADIDSVLATFETSWELDLEKQDSSHKAVHVLVACKLLELASERLGLAAMAAELRAQRTVRMMKDPFTFILRWALASGDPWTLIFNKIMAVSALVSVADLTHVRMMQTGDDITLDRQPQWLHSEGLKAQKSANRGLTWKVEERSQRESGTTFISRGALPNKTIVYKALRTILKYVARPRDRLQHESYRVDTNRLLQASAKLGLQTYCEARCKVFGGDPQVVYDMWTRAIHLAKTPFDELPANLRLDDARPFEIKSREVGCFGYALAHCVDNNIKAVNAIAAYSRPVTTLEAVAVCKDENVPFVVVQEHWAKRSRNRLVDAIETFKVKLTKAFVAIYHDHAVAVVPKTLVAHSAFGKRTFTWKTLHVDGINVHDSL
jgi:hypothetical protein